MRRGLARGIGYEFDGSGIYGVDLDHVIAGAGMIDGAGIITQRAQEKDSGYAMDLTGTLVPQAQEIVSRLNSYTEISPSGIGATPTQKL